MDAHDIGGVLKLWLVGPSARALISCRALFPPKLMRPAHDDHHCGRACLRAAETRSPPPCSSDAFLSTDRTPFDLYHVGHFPDPPGEDALALEPPVSQAALYGTCQSLSRRASLAGELIQLRRLTSNAHG